jgi:hypothetical protein
MVGISQDLTIEQQDAATAAITGWNATHATRLTARVGNMPNGFDGWVQAGRHYEGPGATALTQRNYGTEPVTAVDFEALPQVWWQDAVAHELGHQLGLHHLAGGLMRATVQADTETPMNCVDAAAVAELCGMVACPAGAGGTCGARQ